MVHENPLDTASDYREALRIELHGQSKIFEHIPNRKIIKVKIRGPYMLDIQFIETPEGSTDNVIFRSFSQHTVKEMSYCGGFSIWWK